MACASCRRPSFFRYRVPKVVSCRKEGAGLRLDGIKCAGMGAYGFSAPSGLARLQLFYPYCNANQFAEIMEYVLMLLCLVVIFCSFINEVILGRNKDSLEKYVDGPPQLFGRKKKRK